MNTFLEELVHEHNKTVKEFFATYQQEIYNLVDLIEIRLKMNGKFLCFGNGGSASDAAHFAAEMTGRFVLERKAIPAIDLTSSNSAITAIGNDYGYDQVFARQVEAFALPNDILLGITTSGKSPNVLAAFDKSPVGTLNILLTSSRIEDVENEVKNNQKLDFIFKAPHNNTARIQETHIVFLHVLAQLVEERMK